MYKPNHLRDESAERLIRWLLIGCLLSPLLCTCAAVPRQYPAEHATPTCLTNLK